MSPCVCSLHMRVVDPLTSSSMSSMCKTLHIWHFEGCSCASCIGPASWCIQALDEAFMLLTAAACCYGSREYQSCFSFVPAQVNHSFLYFHLDIASCQHYSGTWFSCLWVHAILLTPSNFRAMAFLLVTVSIGDPFAGLCPMCHLPGEATTTRISVYLPWWIPCGRKEQLWTCHLQPDLSTSSSSSLWRKDQWAKRRPQRHWAQHPVESVHVSFHGFCILTASLKILLKL